MRKIADPFYRDLQERREHEAFWKGYADGLDHTGADPFYLNAGSRSRRIYLDGYQGGFYDRKRRETHSPEDLATAVYRGSSRSAIERTRLPWWRNYTRGGR